MGSILIIEDDEELLLLVKKAFELKNFEVFIARNIKEGLEIFKDNKIDILFADIILKDGDMISHLNEFLSLKKVIVILTTGYSDMVGEINNPEILFFIKPYDIDIIIRQCRKLLSGKLIG